VDGDFADGAVAPDFPACEASTNAICKL
jgi:hypothetical protein